MATTSLHTAISLLISPPPANFQQSRAILQEVIRRFGEVEMYRTTRYQRTALQGIPGVASAAAVLKSPLEFRPSSRSSSCSPTRPHHDPICITIPMPAVAVPPTTTTTPPHPPGAKEQPSKEDQHHHLNRTIRILPLYTTSTINPRDFTHPLHPCSNIFYHPYQPPTKPNHHHHHDPTTFRTGLQGREPMEVYSRFRRAAAEAAQARVLD